jgi:hypothetical protein
MIASRGDRINSVDTQRRVAAHAMGAAVDPLSLIEIKTGATIMRYALATATRGALAPSARPGDGETTYHQASLRTCRRLRSRMTNVCAAPVEVPTGFKWARSFGCSAVYAEKSFHD